MRLWRMMSKSKFFLLVSLIFLLANFCWLIFFDNQKNNPDFAFDEFYTFKALVKNTDKKFGWRFSTTTQNLFGGRGFCTWRLLFYLPSKNEILFFAGWAE